MPRPPTTTIWKRSSRASRSTTSTRRRCIRPAASKAENRFAATGHRSWGVPDITARVLAIAESGETVWSEWEMAGTRRDGAQHLMRGVNIFEVAGRRIRAARFYLEPVEDDFGSVEEFVRSTVSPGPVRTRHDPRCRGHRSARSPGCPAPGRWRRAGPGTDSRPTASHRAPGWCRGCRRRCTKRPARPVTDGCSTVVSAVTDSPGRPAPARRPSTAPATSTSSPRRSGSAWPASCWSQSLAPGRIIRCHCTA